MTHVLTLVADPFRPVLDAALLARAAQCLPAPAAPLWLNEGVAADIPFAPSGAVDNKALQRTVLAALEAPVDAVVQLAAQRRKALFLADMDSTMIAQECIDELADKAGVKAHVAQITERAMRGEIAFEPALRERVALLRGLPVTMVEEVLKDSITVNAGARTLVQTLRKHGCYTALVSGGFTLFTSAIAGMLDFDENRANTLLLSGATFSGTVAEPILGKEAKVAALLELRAKLGLEPWQTMAVGDGANDLAMIHEAGLGLAYRAKPQVAAEAAAAISHADLTALLYIQGYKKSDFVEAL